MAAVGGPVDSDAIRALIAADGLTASTQPDLEEGEPLRMYLASQAAGYQLMHRQGRVLAAFLYAEPDEGFAAFPGRLPGGLSRGAKRAEVVARFGAPERSGGARRIPGLGRQSPWDRFVMGDTYVHFQYTEPEERVRRVTVVAEGWEL